MALCPDVGPSRLLALTDAAACARSLTTDPRIELARAGRLVYDETAGTRCIAAMSTTCANDRAIRGATTDLGLEPCRGVFAPVRPLAWGEACITHDECGDGGRCVETAACGAGRVCAPRLRNQDPCIEDRDCQPVHAGDPMFCAHLAAESLCVRDFGDGIPVGEGEQCGSLGVGISGGDAHSNVVVCAAGLACVLTPTGSRCVRPVARGGTCGAGTPCEAGSACVGGVCAAPSIVGPGGACDPSRDACGDGLVCAGGACGAIVALEGEACTSRPCGTGLVCQAGACARAGSPLGGACAGDGDCAVGSCDAGTCSRVDPCITGTVVPINCAMGWPEDPFSSLRLHCDPTAGASLRLVVTAGAHACDAALDVPRLELTGFGVPPEGAFTAWYEDSSIDQGDARFCLGPSECSPIEGARWHVDAYRAGVDQPAGFAVGCRDDRGLIVTASGSLSPIWCGPTALSCP
jgi:hypothetical protein